MYTNTAWSMLSQYKSLPEAVVHGGTGLLLSMLHHRTFLSDSVKYLLIELMNPGADFLILPFLRYSCAKLFSVCLFESRDV